jgi:hypothetical protein
LRLNFADNRVARERETVRSGERLINMHGISGSTAQVGLVYRLLCITRRVWIWAATRISGLSPYLRTKLKYTANISKAILKFVLRVKRNRILYSDHKFVICLETQINMNGTVFCVITQCAQTFRKNLPPLSSGLKSNPSKIQAEATGWLFWFLIWFNFSSWRWRRYVPPKSQALSDVHGVTTQKTELFIVIAVRTTNSAKVINQLGLYSLHQNASPNRHVVGANFLRSSCLWKLYVFNKELSSWEYFKISGYAFVPPHDFARSFLLRRWGAMISFLTKFPVGRCCKRFWITDLESSK